jgi:hypothetical protein
MAIDTSEIRVGASGIVYVAPTATTLPTDEATAVDAGFIELGAITEDGVTLSPSRSIEKIRAWQSAKAVRTVITEDELSIQFSLMQFNEVTLPLALGGGTITDNLGSYSYTPPAAGTVDERAFIVEWVDGAITSRLVIPRGMVTEVSEIALTKSGAIELGITVEVLGSSPNDFTIYTDDPAFGA